MAFVLFHLTTDTVGTDAYNVYDLPDENVYNEDGTVNEDYLDDLGNDLAFENADSYGKRAFLNNVIVPLGPETVRSVITS